MNERLADLLSSCGTERGVMPPTVLYNEGWMLRLVLDWFSRNRAPGHPLEFSDGARWYSEALLPSQFGPRFRGDPLAEGFTHADGVVGHFTMQPARGDVQIPAGARQFVVAEAKMYSQLSAGTTRAPDFDQAARNAACIAHLLSRGEIAPNELDSLSLFVIAPQEQWERGVFEHLLTKASIREKVLRRCAAFGGAKDTWFSTWFEPTLERLRVEFLSWERLCADVRVTDPAAGTALLEFLERCVQHNRPRSF